MLRYSKLQEIGIVSEWCSCPSTFKPSQIDNVIVSSCKPVNNVQDSQSKRTICQSWHHCLLKPGPDDDEDAAAPAEAATETAAEAAPAAEAEAAAEADAPAAEAAEPAADAPEAPPA